MKAIVLNENLQNSEELELDQMIFGLPPRLDILARVINWQLAKKRTGNHKTKTVSEISGSTKKIYKQKGTGNARHGSKRQVQFRGGSVCFGPLVRSHETSLPKKIRKLGLKLALSAKFQSGDLIVINNFSSDTHKTKDINVFREKIGAKKVLIIDKVISDNLKKASSNLHDMDVLPQVGANVYDIMRKEKIVLTVGAIKALEERLK